MKLEHNLNVHYGEQSGSQGSLQVFFREACHVTTTKSAASLVMRMMTGAKQTTAMKQYADASQVNVLPCGFVVRSEAPHLGASPDGRVFDSKETPPFGLVEVKCTTKTDAHELQHLNILDGRPKLLRSHNYWQVQGQLAISGLSWCVFVTYTETELLIE